MKIGEYGLHARIVSRFIQKRFSASPLTAEWESTLWGDQGATEILPLVKLRSLMTAVVTAVPTLILILLAGVALDQIRGRGPEHMFLCLSAAASVLYVLGGIYMWYRVWPRQHAASR